jgi:hypothetical protein
MKNPAQKVSQVIREFNNIFGYVRKRGSQGVPPDAGRTLRARTNGIVLILIKGTS